VLSRKGLRSQEDEKLKENFEEIGTIFKSFTLTGHFCVQIIIYLLKV